MEKEKLVIVYMVENEDNVFFEWSLQASKAIADHIVILDGGSTDGTRNVISSVLGKPDYDDSDGIIIVGKPKVGGFSFIESPYPHDYKGADGFQRNKYLEHLKKYFSGWLCLVLDADEVLSDNGFLLKENAPKGDFCRNIHMRHYIFHFGLEDASEEVHWVPRRFFRITDDARYPEREHNVLDYPGETLGIDSPNYNPEITLPNLT